MDYHHFLHGYNPVIAPHLLQGSLTLKTYGTTPNSPTNTRATAHSHAGSMVSTTSHHTLPTSAPEFTLDAPSHLLKKTAVKRAAKQARDDLALRLTASTNNLSVSNQSEPQHQPHEVDLRRVWHAMLKECHRADPERTGAVSRNAFITALERGNTNKVRLIQI